MASYDNSYSRFVALVKIFLPLAALALLSTLFLLSRSIDPTASIPYSQVEVEQIVREQRVGAPNYTGVTNDGTAIAVTAKSALPNITNPARASATSLVARLDFKDGTSADITAEHGEVDTDTDIAVLTGNVVIDTSGGYHITTNKLTTHLNETALFTDSTVNADGPLGTLTAGNMKLDPDPNAPGQYLVVFKGGVKLIYDPKE